jgi:hypothetical protein
MAQQQDMGLFGVPSASDILRQQQQQDQMLAMRQAQLAPGQGLIYQAASAGQRAGRSIAGLFGIEDPALKEATEMDAVKKVVASQWDGSDPEKALELFVQEANKRGLTQQALSASERLTKMKADKEKAELGKVKTSYEIGKLAAQTQEAIRKAQQATAAKLPSLVQHQEARDAIEAALQTEQDPQVRTRLETRKKELDNYINKESTREPRAAKKPDKVGVSTTGQVVYYDPETRKQFTFDSQGKEVPFTGQIREGGPNINIDTKDLYGFVRGANADLAPIVKQVSTLETALNLLNQQSSPFASRALEQQIASVFGDANKAREEIKALANTGSLDERIANNILNFLSGTKTDATKSDQLTVLRALRTKLGKDYENTATPLRSALKGNKNVDPNQVIPPFSTRFGELPLSTTGQRTTKSGTTYTVE